MIAPSEEPEMMYLPLGENAAQLTDRNALARLAGGLNERSARCLTVGCSGDVNGGRPVEGKLNETETCRRGVGGVEDGMDAE